MHWSAETLLPLSEIDEEEPTALAGVVGWLGTVGAGMVPSGWCIGRRKQALIVVLTDRYCFALACVLQLIHPSL